MTLEDELTQMGSRTKYVPMNMLAVTSATDEKPRVGTNSLASCAGIAIYDAEHKIGGVAHVYFNGKISIVDYLRDAEGRDIPSTGKAFIINNPCPFAPFMELAEALVKRADEIGGEKYRLMAFNIEHGCRTPEQNKQLKEVVERTIEKLKQARKITSTEYRNETEFSLDTRTGQIIPYCRFEGGI